jgi:hypothetical protein
MKWGQDLKAVAKAQWALAEEGKKGLSMPAAILLQVALAGGILVLALAAPNVLQLFAPVFKQRSRSSWYPSGVKKRINSLARQKLVDIEEKGGVVRIQLTAGGKKKVLSFALDGMQIKSPSRWDGRWRIVAFDVPEKKRRGRDIFRQKLKELGFKEFQQSVWAHQHSCLEEVSFLVHLYELEPYMTYFEGTVPKLLK